MLQEEAFAEENQEIKRNRVPKILGDLEAAEKRGELPSLQPKKRAKFTVDDEQVNKLFNNEPLDVNDDEDDNEKSVDIDPFGWTGTTKDNTNSRRNMPEFLNNINENAVVLMNPNKVKEQ